MRIARYSIMEIKGTVEGIIFRNAENGYTVAAVDIHGIIITAVGIFPPLTEGEDVRLVGDYKANSRYGEQFVVEEVVVSPPTGVENITKYLASGLFRGIGIVTATAIAKKFGENTFDIIEFNPSRLAEVKGVSKKKAEEISGKFIELRRMQNAIMFLTQYHVSLNLALKIYRCYDVNTESVVKTNPYRLVGEVEGVGFKTADMIAMSLGIKEIDTNRIKAAIRYTMAEIAARSGHTLLPTGRIYSEVKKLLSFDDEDCSLINNALEDLETMGEVVPVSKDNATGLMLDKYYNLENGISKHLVRLMGEGRPLDLTLDKELDYYESTNNITLHDRQREAVSAAINYGGVIITGGPGTGKTTIIKCIIYLLERLEIPYSLTAPTGRASKRMNEATGRAASTMHRLLEINKNSRGNCNFNENNPLPCRVVIVDEISMADEFIMYALLRALDHGTKLIFVGDKDQLPSVGAGSVLSDLIESKIMPVVYLNHIYRQAEGSFIITNAHLINKGILPEPDRSSKDFFFDYQYEEDAMLEHTIQFCIKRISTYLDVKSDDIQVLAPLKMGVAGVVNLNSALQQAINPPHPAKAEIHVGNTVFRLGDRVIQTANNYDIEWTKTDGTIDTNGTGVFNGDVGKVVEINKAALTVTIKFEDDRVAVYLADELDELSLAYAISVHKSQGSEFKVVILVVSRYNPMVLSKNLFYTAVTRAKEMVVVVGNPESVQKMTRNRYIEKRSTALVELIKNALSENE